MIRRWRSRQVASAGVATVSTTRRTTALQPLGTPWRMRDEASSHSPAYTARPATSVRLAMPDRAAPSRRSTRNTMASDHTAARSAMQPTSTNRARYAAEPTAVRREGRPLPLRAPNADSATAGTRVTRATSHPPNQRAATIVRTGTGVSHVKWKVPARISAPSTASPITRQAMGISSANRPSGRPGGTHARAGVRSHGSRPNRTAPTQGRASDDRRCGGIKSAACNRGRRWRPSRDQPLNMLSSESSRGGTSSSRASSERASRGARRPHRGQVGGNHEVVAVRC